MVACCMYHWELGILLPLMANIHLNVKMTLSAKVFTILSLKV